MDAHGPQTDGPQTDGPQTDSPSVADTLTAYHEAGHAVVALLMGRLVQRVSILPKLTRLGQCELKKGSNKPPKDWLESEGLILLAGAAAEGRISGRYCWAGAAADLRQVRALICSRAASVKQAERLEKRWLDKVESLLDVADTWLAVELIAADLLSRRTISGRAARHHYEQAVARVAKQRKG
ncbi:cell division protein FtsH [Planctomycetaceae bacterium SH139]